MAKVITDVLEYSLSGNTFIVNGVDLLDIENLTESINLVGTPTAPTPLITDDSTRIATTEFVKDNLSLYLPLTGGTVSGNLVIQGSFVAEGDPIELNSVSVIVEDKNIILGNTAFPTNITADGGGITLRGTVDKTFNYINTTSSWTSSESIDLLSGKSYKINGTDVLTSTTVLGKTVPVGTIIGSTDAQTLTNKTLVAPILGTPTSGLLTNCTGLPEAGVIGLTSSLNAKQPLLVSGTSIKTVNGITLLGSGNITISGGGYVGLANFSEELITTVPNNIINAARLIPITGTTNVGTVIGIKGDGYLSTVVPDNEYSIGNKSIFLSTYKGVIGEPFIIGTGSFAVLTDQPYRGLSIAANSISINSDTRSRSIGISPILNDEDAGIVGARAGTDSISIGTGSYSGNGSLSLGSDTSVSNNSVGIGANTTVDSNAIGIGISVISTVDSTAIGNDSEARNTGIALGNSANCAGFNSIALGNSTQESRNGLVTYGAQTLAGVYEAYTYDAIPIRLENPGGTGGNSTILSILYGTAISIEATIFAQSSTGLISQWKITGALKQPTDAASTVLAYTPILQEVINEIGIVTLPTIIADTTSGGGVFRVTGLTTTSIKWVVTIINVTEI
jgi:hypothetical protein